MMPKFLPLIDRAVEGLPMPDPSGAMPDLGAAAGGEGVDGARPRSAFAELMSVREGDAETGADGARGRALRVPSSEGEVSATEPFAPGFDLPAFLQVLPRSGKEVAVAAAREPGLAAAVRRLPTPQAASEARSVDAPDVAIRLPSFLVPPKVDAPSSQSAATAGGTSDMPSPAITQGPSRPEASARASDPARTATAALESALRRAGSTNPAKDNAAVPSASAAPATAPSLVDPLAQGAVQPSMSTPVQSLASHATRHKTPPPSAVGRKESGLRAEAAERSPREPSRSEPSALLNSLQRSFESTAPRTETSDRGSDMRPSPTPVGVGAAPDLMSASTASFVDPGDRQGQATVSLRQPVGTEAWQDELSAQLSFMADQGEGTEAVMKLAPEELGELEVRVEVRDGEAALQFGVANAEARQAVEAAQTKLRDLFTSQGMNVSEFSVFSNLNGNSQFASSDGRGSRSNPRSAVRSDRDLEVVVRPRRSVGVVDLYA